MTFIKLPFKTIRFIGFYVTGVIISGALEGLVKLSQNISIPSHSRHAIIKALSI